MGPGGRYYQPRPQRMPMSSYAPVPLMRLGDSRPNVYPPRMMRMPPSRNVIPRPPGVTPLFRHPPASHSFTARRPSLPIATRPPSAPPMTTRPVFSSTNATPPAKTWPTLHGVNKTSAAHVVFDMTHCESYFPRATPALSAEEEKTFTDLLVQRHSEICLPQNQLTFITTLVSQFAAIIDQLVVNPSAFEAAKVIEVRPVGAFKGQSLMRDQCEAELVLVLQTLPTRLAVDGLGDYCAEQLHYEYANSHYGYMRLKISSESRDYGFDIMVVDLESSTDVKDPKPIACLRVQVCATPSNMVNLDPELHLSAYLQQAAHTQLRRSRWFEENATHTSIRVLIRLLKDIASRFDGMHHLTPWMIDLLAHYTITNNSEGQPLPINVAFRRVFQLLATGLFLPGSVGIIDPCQTPSPHTGVPRVHFQLTADEQDELCCAAQTLLRVLTHNGYKYILQAEPEQQTINIINQVSSWNGIVVAPSEKVVSICPEVEAAEEEIEIR